MTRKEQLWAELSAQGVEYDKRWGVDRLENALAAVHSGEPEESQANADAAAGQVDEDLCRVRITKFGNDRIHDGNQGRYAWKDEVLLPLDVAAGLEARGWAEIEG